METAQQHQPEPLTVLDRHGEPCPRATSDSYPLTAACTCGAGAIMAMDGTAEWGHPAPRKCYCPDDCNCHFDHRPIYCGCTAHLPW